MKYAVNKWLKKTFDADSAPPGNGYHCPVCSAPVTLRAGDERVAYFAHKAGMGTRDCDLYYPGASASHAQLAHHDLANGKWEFVLGIQIATTGYPRGWGLELSLLSKEDAFAEIEIDVGGRTQKLELRGESEKTKRITAEPQTKEYSVISVKPEHGLVANSLVKTCASLNASNATVFGDASKRSGVTIPRAGELHLTGRYVFIWSKDAGLDFPEEICVEILESKVDWQAGILDIPANVSDTCKDWLQRCTGLELKAAMPSFIPVWPPTVCRIGPQLSLVYRGAPVYLHTSGLLANKSAHSVVYARSGREDIAVNVYSAQTPFLKILPESEMALQVSCRDNLKLRIELDFCIDSTYTLGLPVVTFAGETEYGTLTSVHLHDQNASAWLQRVASGEITLTSLAAPAGLCGVLRTGRQGVWTVETKLEQSEINRNRSGPILFVNDVPLIVESLRNISLDTNIDFGGFGRVTVIAQQLPLIVPVLRLSASLRSRLKAYLVQLPRPRTRQYFDVDINDQDLADLAISTCPTGKTLATHRSLISELNLVKAIKKR